jgi:hypothetical protein
VTLAVRFFFVKIARARAESGLSSMRVFVARVLIGVAAVIGVVLIGGCLGEVIHYVIWGTW